jgi:hypothetical protein
LARHDEGIGRFWPGLHAQLPELMAAVTGLRSAIERGQA